MEIQTGCQGPIVLGTCETMCPRRELLMREEEGLLDTFEMTLSRPDYQKRGSRPPADPNRVVKKYSRPAAGRPETDLSDLRPAPVLKRTMNYLLHEVAALAQPAWSEIYAFIFDRSRAVRQDMVIQGIVGHDAICILEQVVRFHAYAAYRLRHEDIADFDPVLNKHHLLECLKRLLYLYQVTKGPHDNRAEFEAVYLLDNLGDEAAMTHCLELPEDLRMQPVLRTAFDISKKFCLRNYCKVLKLIHSMSSCICLCVVSCHLYNLQVNYLQILSHAYSVKNCRFPIGHLALLLQASSPTDAFDLCSDCGLVDMFDQDSNDVIQFNKSKFQRPNKDKAVSSLGVLDNVLGTSVSRILLGLSTETTATGNQLAGETDGGLTTIQAQEGEERGATALEFQLNKLELDPAKSSGRMKTDNLHHQNDYPQVDDKVRCSHDSYPHLEIRTQNPVLSSKGNVCLAQAKHSCADGIDTKPGNVEYRERMGGVVSEPVFMPGQGRSGGRGRGRGRGKKSGGGMAAKT